MVKHIDPDMTLLKMPSLKAVKSFVAAAKYQSFTRAAEALCVTQAAISRQIRELEAYLGVDLFKRVGRAVELTEAGDIFITKMARIQDGYRSYPLFHDVIYPVCTPRYKEEHPELSSLEGLRDGVLLNLSPYGRSQVAEHVDWGVWLAYHDVDIEKRPHDSPHVFNANDYNLVISMVLTHQGVALGWNHLVATLIENGTLIRPIEEEVVLHESQHYLTFREDRINDDACCRLRDWILAQFS